MSTEPETPEAEDKPEGPAAEEPAPEQPAEEESSGPPEEAAPEAEAESVEEEAPGPPEEEAPPEQPESVTFADLTIYETLRFMVGMLSQQGWVHLGLQVAPSSQDPQMDLAQARVAIDTLEVVVDKLEPDTNEEEKRELITLLSNLRINYLKKAE